MNVIYSLKSVAGMTVMLAGMAAAPFAQAELSLPQVNDSAIGYGKSVDGAVSDKLFYTLGGGSVISQPATRSNMKKLGLDIGWSSDLMCGNFDLKTTVGNQLNGVTAGFKNLMGEVIQGATGAVASLPAMLIQRANPGLYDMLTNGVLQANVSFDKAQLNCQNMAKKMMDFTDSSAWTQQAMLEEYKSIVNSGDGDAVRLDNAGRKVTGNKGSSWVGGQKRGGVGQPAIRPTHDLAAAGFNMMNSLPVTSSSTVSASSCNGGACSKFSSAEEAAEMVVKVLGDKAMRTCGDASKCKRERRLSGCGRRENSDDGQIVHKAYATGCHPENDSVWRSMGDILITGEGNNVTRLFLTDGQRWDIVTKSVQLVAFQEDEFPKVFTGHREYVPVATYREYTEKLNALAEQFDSCSREWGYRTWREIAYSLIWEYHMSDCKRASCDEHNLFVLALNKLYRRARKLSLSGELLQG